MRKISESVSVKCEEDFMKNCIVSFVPDSFNVCYVGVIPLYVGI